MVCRCVDAGADNASLPTLQVCSLAAAVVLRALTTGDELSIATRADHERLSNEWRKPSLAGEQVEVLDSFGECGAEAVGAWAPSRGSANRARS